MQTDIEIIQCLLLLLAFASCNKGLAILTRIEVVTNRAAVLELDVVSAVLRRAIPALQVVGSEGQHFLAFSFERHLVLIAVW